MIDRHTETEREEGIEIQGGKMNFTISFFTKKVIRKYCTIFFKNFIIKDYQSKKNKIFFLCLNIKI